MHHFQKVQVMACWLAVPRHYLKQVRFCGIHPTAISQQVPDLLFCVMSLKILPLKPLSHLPGINELRWHIRWSHGTCTPIHNTCFHNLVNINTRSLNIPINNNNNNKAKSEGFDSCGWPSDLVWPAWPWNCMDDHEKQSSTNAQIRSTSSISRPV